MKINRKGAGAIGAGIVVAMLATACGAGAGAGAAEGGIPGYEQPRIAEAQRVGAMEDFSFGDTFVATQPIDVSLMYRVHGAYGVEDDWRFFQALTENHNVTFDRLDIPLADFDERRNMLIAAGDFPSVITHVAFENEVPWIAGGALLPVSDYFQYMPHFSHSVREWGIQEELDTLRQEDGRIYRLPGLLESPALHWSMIINQDLFDEAGITQDPTTTDEWLDVMEQVVANTGAQYGYAALHSNLNASLMAMAPNFNTTGGWAHQAVHFDHDAGEFVATALTDGYRQLVEFYAAMTERGILDPEIADYDLTAEKFINGRVAAITSTAGHLQTRIDEAREAGLPGNFRKLVLPDGPDGGFVDPSQLAWGIALNANLRNSPYFLATLQFIDWLWFSPEGQEFALFGIEGETFERAEDGTRILREDLYWRVMNAGAPNNLVREYGFGDMTFAVGYGGSDDLVQGMLNDSLREWKQGMLAAKTPLPLTPAAPLTDLELERIATTQTAVIDHVRAETLRFILGDRPMSDWDAFTAEVEALGVQRIVDIHNEALNR